MERKQRSSSSAEWKIKMIVAVVGLYLFLSIFLYVRLESVHTMTNQLFPRSQYFIERRLKGNPKEEKKQKRAGASRSSSITTLFPANQKHHQQQQQHHHHHRSSLSSRARFERTFPPNDLDRVHRRVEALRVQPPETQSHDASLPYDIYNCPPEPSIEYPTTWKLVNQILAHWNPSNTTIPSRIYQSLCVFDWDRDADDREKAQAYRLAGVPFVLQNHPEVLRASERWNHPGYLEDMIGPEPQMTEHSLSSHLMYWKLRHAKNERPVNWQPPTEIMEMPFAEFQKHALEMETLPKEDQLHREHWYFRLNGDYQGHNSYLFDELPFFRVDQGSSLFVVDPDETRGINCRFGMRGNIAETHYDSSLNWIVVMGGQRRYILAPPLQCRNMELYHFGHPSARHSSIDWTNPPSGDEDRPFSRALASEVVLQPGDALYLPDSYFHFIVSLNINYQCNARSGTTLDPRKLIEECELNVPKSEY